MLHHRLASLRTIVRVSTVLIPFALAVLAPSASAQSGPALQWKPLYEPGVGGWVTSLSVCPSNPNLILSGGDILGIARSADGGVSWTRPSTPTGSYMIEEFTWHPESGVPSSTHHGEVWVGTSSGPWKSTDFGQTWVRKRTGMPQPNRGDKAYTPFIQKILVDPTVPSSGPRRLLAFFGTDRLEKKNGSFPHSGAVYVSTDGGENWSALGQTVPTTVTSTQSRLVNAAAYKVNGADGDKIIYAATASGFYKSTDDGLNWTQKSSGLPAADKNIRALAVHPTNGQILWITVGGSGVYKSTNGGDTWFASNSGLAATYGTYDAIAVSPSDPNLLFTAHIDDKKLYRSTDGGANWVLQPSAALGSSPNPIYRDFRTLIAHPTQAGVFLSGTPTDIWKTTNAAAANDLDNVAPYTGPLWTNMSSVPRNGGWSGTGFSGLVANQFRWNPYNNNEAAIAAMDNGKFVSRDALQSWKFAGGGTGKGIGDWWAWRDFSFSATPGHWYAAHGQYGNVNAVYRTTNAGASWSTISKPSVDGVSAGGNPDIVHVHRNDSTRVWVIWGGKLYYSASAGASGTWSLQANDSTIYDSINDLVADPADTTGQTLWIGTAKGLFRSTDGGVNWSKVGASGSPQNLSRVRLDPTNPQRIWVVNALHEKTNSWDTGLYRLVFNSNLTGTWSKLATWGDPGSPVKRIWDVAVDPTNGNRIVAATSEDNWTVDTLETGVWVNDNNGASNAWRREVNGLGVQRARTVAFRPGTSEVVVGTMGGGYFIADTNGSIIDLSPTPDVFQLDAHPSDAEARRVGTGDGGGTVGNATATELHVGNANNGGSAYSPVYAFQLPDLGAVSNPFTTATFTVGLSTSTTTFAGHNVDVYGLPARAAATVLASDAFCGALDSTGATRLADNWINLNVSPAVPTGLRTLSNAALVSYLNAQYASGAGAGKYVFLRLSPDAAGNTWKNVKFAASEYTANPAWRPTLVVE